MDNLDELKEKLSNSLTDLRKLKLPVSLKISEDGFIFSDGINIKPSTILWAMIQGIDQRAILLKYPYLNKSLLTELIVAASEISLVDEETINSFKSFRRVIDKPDLDKTIKARMILSACTISSRYGYIPFYLTDAWSDERSDPIWLEKEVRVIIHDEQLPETYRKYLTNFIASSLGYNKFYRINLPLLDYLEAESNLVRAALAGQNSITPEVARQRLSEKAKRRN